MDISDNDMISSPLHEAVSALRSFVSDTYVLLLACNSNMKIPHIHDISGHIHSNCDKPILFISASWIVVFEATHETVLPKAGDD